MATNPQRSIERYPFGRIYCWRREIFIHLCFVLRGFCYAYVNFGRTDFSISRIICFTAVQYPTVKSNALFNIKIFEQNTTADYINTFERIQDNISPFHNANSLCHGCLNNELLVHIHGARMSQRTPLFLGGNHKQYLLDLDYHYLYYHRCTNPRIQNHSTYQDESIDTIPNRNLFDIQIQPYHSGKKSLGHYDLLWFMTQLTAYYNNCSIFCTNWLYL